MAHAHRRAAAGADPRVLRGGPGRARLPRGRRAPRARPLQRDRGRRASRRALPLGRERRPVGPGCGAFATVAVAGTRADADRRAAGGLRALGSGAQTAVPQRARTVPASPSTRCRRRPSRAGRGLRAATLADLDLLVPACALAHEGELGIDPLRRDADGFRWRTRAQIEEGRSWLWEEDGVILFKAEASAWTPQAVQLQQVWTDPEARGAGNAGRGLRDLIRLLLEQVPTVCLFVRADNDAAIRLYDTRRDGARARLPERAPVRTARSPRGTASPSSAPRQLVNGDPGGRLPADRGRSRAGAGARHGARGRAGRPRRVTDRVRARARDGRARAGRPRRAAPRRSRS